MYALLRLGKLLSVALVFAGTAGVFFAQTAEMRRRAAFWIAGPGYALAWIAGLSLAGFRGISLLSTFVLLGFGFSLFSLQVVLFVAGRPERGSWQSAALAFVPLVATVALMVFRPA